MSAPFVSVEQLAIDYGEFRAVDEVSFGIEAGQQVTLLGPSGCGKTTTLRAVAGLERPRAGRIVIDGKAVFDGATGVDAPPEKRGLSMVFQSYAIWPHMTVFENVAFPFRVRGRPASEAKPAVDKALALVDLARFADRPATMLSGGQQQRVALARAIAFGAKVVLLDEPLSNLDAQLRIQMRDELADLRRRLGFTALYVTHDQEEAFSLSDHIIVMRGGRIEQAGKPQDIYSSPRTRFVAEFLGVRNIVECELTGAGDDQAEARLANGSVLRGRHVDPGSGSASAAIAFRPGDVRLEDADTEGQGGSGVVIRSLFVGDHQHVFIQSGPIELCAHVRPRAGLEVGRTLFWRVAPNDCLIMRK
ncbi:ABC transporter ATP-binding protein [Terrarubrum flagellatum]|uniref:ABC transporter ATP-binding protein n=1 Tax=Terrirubrum flagellatum TaxID=2895980 RepID=UPI0031455E08